MSSDDIRDAAKKYAALNAYAYDGKAQSGPIVGRIMGESPELRTMAKEVIAIINEVVKEVNSWTREQQEQILKERWPELLVVKKVVEEKKTLPPLENVDKYDEIRTRFAPNPDGPLHLGSAEPIIFCDEYAKMYDGTFVLRFEDTSPDVKAPIPEMYQWIREDLEWLGVKTGEEFIQSDRVDLYYEYARKLLELGGAYVCTCESAEFKELYVAKKACPCRELSPETQIERWEKMLDRTYKKGDAVVRVKTDLAHPNPAIRDWPALRIAESSHPRVGHKYHVWPLYNFSTSIDDHFMKITHIIRGKEHEVNSHRQKYIYQYFNWDFPEIINIGRLGLEVGILSKSKIRKGLEDGLYNSWDDPRLGTIRALKRRGLQPETIREIMIQVGPKPINSTLSWENVASANRKNIETRANRYYFIRNPVTLEVDNIPRDYDVKLPLHPDHVDRGYRDHTIKPSGGKSTFVISSTDADKLQSGAIIRLMGLFNVEITNSGTILEGSYHSDDHIMARDLNAPFVQWLLEGKGIEATVVMPDASEAKGLAEPECLNLSVDDMIQFERYGFARIDNLKPLVAYYSHR